jgi:hypothetical protein
MSCATVNLWAGGCVGAFYTVDTAMWIAGWWFVGIPVCCWDTIGMNRKTEDILTLSIGCAFDRQQGGGGWHGVVDTTEEERACVWEVRGG